MMRAALILVSTLVLAACNMAAEAQRGEGDSTGGGAATQRSYDLAGFDSVSLAGPHDVRVSVGNAHSVRAEGDPEVLDKLEIKVDGRNLEIGMKRGRWSFRNKPKTTIYVTMPAIRSAAIAGSGDMRIDRAEGEEFSASIGGSGDMQVGALRVGSADFSVAGSGNVRAAGSAGRSKVSIAGSGDVDVGSLESREAKVSIVGSGNVRARAMETADISIMGSGDVEISGSAKCSVSKMGSGDVRCTG
jgi:hypothetical protein